MKDFVFIWYIFLCLIVVTVSMEKFNVPNKPIRSRSDYNIPMPTIQENDLNKAGRKGINSFRELKHLEEELWRKGLTVKRGTKEATHQALFGNNFQSQQLGRDGMISVVASVELSNRFHLNEIQGRDGLTRFSKKNTSINVTCPETSVLCSNSGYRTIDGSCNNLDNPFWGKSFTSFERLLSPDYADGLNQPRRAKDGGELPSPRLVSALIAPDRDFPHGYLTAFFVHWGQFVDHDITLTALTRAINGEGITCCSQEIQSNPRLKHPACLPISISENDTFYSNFNQRCMEFVRSLPAPRPRCNFGPREQLNQLTSYIDGSNVYGSVLNVSNELRTFVAGKMTVNLENGATMLPRSVRRNEQCQKQQTQQYCFMAGDIRVNENINLAVMHTIWLREHNRIAEELARINPHWVDERLYQETRRIVGAMMQHLTYKEYLPLLLGRTVFNTFGLQLKSDDFSYNYDSSINPSILNSFAAAAYRFGHTLIQGLVDMKNDTRVIQQLSQSDHLFNPGPLYQRNNMEKLLKGMVDQPAQTYDRYVTSKLTNHLFERPGQHFGLDLISLNIQRGRDHGLPGYIQWRKICQLSPVRNFRDLERIMGKLTTQIFRGLYRSVDDIDLFPAGISEKPLSDGVLGPTFACIIAEQFRRLKLGDRFWYENGGELVSFTEDQLQAIRNATLARILCENVEDLVYIQKEVLLRHADWNPKISCQNEDIPRVDLQYWFDDPSWRKK